MASEPGDAIEPSLTGHDKSNPMTPTEPNDDGVELAPPDHDKLDPTTPMEPDGSVVPTPSGFEEPQSMTLPEPNDSPLPTSNIHDDLQFTTPVELYEVPDMVQTKDQIMQETNFSDFENIEDYLEPDATKGVPHEAQIILSAGNFGSLPEIDVDDLIPIEVDMQNLLNDNPFNSPVQGNVADLDNGGETSVPQVDSEPSFMREQSTDVEMHDTQLANNESLTSEIPSFQVEETTIPGNPSNDNQEGHGLFMESNSVHQLEPSSNGQQLVCPDSWRHDDESGDHEPPPNVSTHAGEGEIITNNSTEFPDGDAAPPRPFNLSRSILNAPKASSRMAQLQSEKTTKAWEALQRRAARENGDTSAYPSPQAGTPGGSALPSISDKIHREIVDGEPLFEEGHMAADPDSDPEPSPKFLIAKKLLERRRRSGIATVEDDIQFKKMEKEEKLRVQRLKARQEFAKRGQEQSLFVDQDSAGPSFAKGNESSDEGVNPHKRPADDEGDEAPPKKRRPRKQNRIPAQDLRESMAVGLESEIGKGQKKSRKKSDNASAKKDAKSSKAKDKEAKKCGRAKKGPQMTNLESLYKGNIIEAATRNRGALEQPKFTSKNKASALSELIASIPVEERSTVGADKHALLDATKKFSGFSAMKSDGAGGWKLKGMKSSLFHYQLLGAAFMRDRENCGDRPHGGFQADEMGFGKTVMMIANILDGKPAADEACKTTLIVATPGLATQWLTEIQKHCEPGAMGEVVKYHSGNRIASADIVTTLQKCDVIITTYNEVRRSYPACKPPLHLVTEAQKNVWWAAHYAKEVGALHKIHFRRIVLDEAQAIKNAESKTSVACRGLNGKFRWAISGTPIQNTVEEFFPYFRFLKVKHTGSIETFKANFITKKDTIGMERLHSLLRTMMIRRTHLDTIFGRPILKLPDIEQKTIEVEFNPVERSIYNILKARFCLRINNYSRQGLLDSRYRHIFSMMLALRQLTGHILLVQRVLKDILQVEDIEALMQITSKEQNPENSNGGTLRELRGIIVKHNMNGHAAPQVVDEAPVDLDQAKTPPKTPEEEEPLDLGRGFGITFRFRKCLRALYDSARWDELTKRSLCHHCLQPPEEPMLTDCLHLYCKECLNAISFEAVKNGQERASCKECGKVYEMSTPCDGIQELSSAGDPRTPRTPREREGSISSASTKGRNGKNAKKDDQVDDSDWISELPGHLLPSSKVMALKMQVLEWLKAEPDCKILVFTQFLDMIRILSRMCNNEGWGWCQFTGKMGFDARDRAINDFRDDPEKKLLLCSLKAGGIGLNLTMASKVIILDLYWNECVEQQAFCRAFRIGQERMVEVVRFVVKNSIDTDMVRMQQRKTQEIDAAIGKNGSSTRYTVQELMRLFGPVHENEFGQEFIWVEDEDEQSDSLNDLDVMNHLPPRPF